MEENRFDRLSAAFGVLNDPSALEEVGRLRHQNEEGLYFVAFVGQFSAGKSTLLNNLLGRKILPEGTTETTPVLTYLRYGEDERAHLFFLDGTEREIALEDIARIMQRGANSLDFDLDRIEHLEVFVRSELLSNGMVLLDTPGFNTLIERHEQLLAETLSLASNIVCVSGRALSKPDAEKISAMMEHGFPMTFVRTRCDEINEIEESYEQVRREELKTFRETLGDRFDEARFFHISNLPQSPYFSKIDGIRNLLGAVGRDVRASLDESIGLQLDELEKKASEGLASLMIDLKTRLANRDDELARKRQKLENEIAALNSKLERNRSKLEAKARECCRSLKSESEDRIEKEIDRMTKKIFEAREINGNDAMKLFLQTETRQVLQRFLLMINNRVDPLLKEINGEAEAVGGVGIDWSELPEAQDYTTLIGEQDAQTAELNRQLTLLRENRAELEENLSAADGEELQSLQTELAALEDELGELQREQSGKIYEPQYKIVESDNTGERIGKGIGNILDIALIFLPQTAFVQSAKNVGVIGKLSNAAGKAGKYLGATFKGLKIGGSVSAEIGKVSKFYRRAAQLNKAKQMVLTASEGMTKLKKSVPVGFLDYLTAEHWGEQLGKQFDDPPRRVEDQEHKARFEEEKQALADQILRRQRAVFERKKELGLFRDRIEEERARLDSLKLNEDELARQLKSRESQLREEAKRQSLDNWRRAWATRYAEQLREQLSAQVEIYMREMPDRLNAYLETRLAAIENKLLERKRQYDELSSLSSTDIEAKIAEVGSLQKSFAPAA